MKSFGRRRRELSEDGEEIMPKNGTLTRAPAEIWHRRVEIVVNRWLPAIIPELEHKTLPKVSNRRMTTERHGPMPANVCDKQSNQISSKFQFDVIWSS